MQENQHETSAGNGAQDPGAGTGGIAEAFFDGWEGPAVGLMDLDAFFASVEQLDHPSWRGRPVIVGGAPEERGVVSTASYEARPYGVHSGMSSAEAKRLCPQAIWTHGHRERYREMSAQVMAILSDETPYVDQVSIDEAFFDITPGRYSSESPVAICQRIMERVGELGISCSIGLGVNKTVAKIASERDKPRGLTVVPPGTESEFLAPLPVRTMSGIGDASASALEARGIRTLGALAATPLETLQPIFGVNAETVRLRAQGAERSPVREAVTEEEAKSVSSERTFPHDLTDRADVEAAIALLGEKVGRRLRREGLVGRTVTLKLKFSYSRGRSCQRTLPHPTDDEHIFVPVALELLDEVWTPGMQVRLVGVGMGEFRSEEGVQTDLFCELDERGAQASDRRDLSVALDQVAERFGAGAVTYGRAARFEGAAGGDADNGDGWGEVQPETAAGDSDGESAHPAQRSAAGRTDSVAGPAVGAGREQG